MSGGPVTGFEIGDVLRRGLAILMRNLAPFGLLSLALMSPPFILALVLGPGLVGHDPSPHAGVAIVAFVVVAILLYFLLSAALIHGTIRELRGGRSRLGESVRWGLSLLFPVVAVAFVTSLGVFAGPAVIVAVGMAVIPNPWVILPPALVVGLVLFTRWWLAIAVAVVERPGTFRALRRSAELTAGYRWRVFAILTIVLIGQNVLDRAAGVLLFWAPALLVVASLLIAAAATAYTAVVSAVCYHDLRVLKDGDDADDIARVFD